jgi:hypothetical protein
MNKTAGVLGWVIVIIIIIGAGLYLVSKNMPSPYMTAAPSNAVVTSVAPVSANPTSSAGVPTVTTSSSVAPTDTTVVLTGSVVPNGAFTNYWYEYGPTSSLGLKTTIENVGSGYMSIPTPGYITGLSANTSYYYRLAAQNGFGTVYGSQYSFDTTQGNPPPTGGAPSVSTNPANSLTRTGATLNGQVTPDGVSTNYWFEYGPTASLGNTTALSSVGSGSSNVPVSAALSDLNPLATYYFRIDAENQFGIVNGAINSFVTAGPASPAEPTAATRSVVSISSTTATYRGTVNPNGATTNYWFEYGVDPAFGSGATQTTTGQTINGNTGTAVSLNVVGLAPSTTYYVRIVAQNTAGTVDGDSVSFTTRAN